MKPDSEKSTLEKGTESAKGTADSVASSLQPGMTLLSTLISVSRTVFLTLHNRGREEHHPEDDRLHLLRRW